MKIRARIDLLKPIWIVLLLSATASAQQPSWKESSEVFAATAVRIEETDIKPLIEALSKKTTDPDLRRLLAQIEVYVPKLTPLSMFAIPNARAEWEAGNRWLAVDITFAFRIHELSSLAGLAMTGSTLAGQIIEAAGFEYGKQAATALESGQRVPDFSINLDELPGNPSIKVMAEELQSEASAHAFAWVVLHEVAHHKLGHLTRCIDKVPCPPLSPEESRSAELDCDRWAFRQMKLLGYSFNGLLGYFAAEAVVEEMRAMLGIGIPESESTHPSFATRYATLAEFGQTGVPPNNAWIIVAILTSDDYTGAAVVNPMVTKLFVPRNPSGESSYLASMIEPGSTVFMATERIGDKIVVYGRNAVIRNEIVLENFDDNVWADVTFINTEPSTGQKFSSRTNGYQMDLMPYLYHPQFPESIRQFLVDVEPLQFAESLLVEMGRTPTEISAVVDVLRRNAIFTQANTISYAKGESAMLTNMAEAQRQANETRNAIESIIGVEGYREYLRRVASSDAGRMAMDALPGILEEARKAQPQ